MLEIMLGMYSVGMFVELMIVRNGIQYVTKLMRVELICSVFRKPKESFDLQYIRKFAPKRFDLFDFCPSNGASRGILVC
jgi:hypothetical protein